MADDLHNNRILQQFNKVEEEEGSPPHPPFNPANFSNPFGVPFNPITPPLNPPMQSIPVYPNPTPSFDPNTLSNAFNRLNLSNTPLPNPATNISIELAEIQYHQERIQELEMARLLRYNSAYAQPLYTNFNNSYPPTPNSRCRCDECRENSGRQRAISQSRAQLRGGRIGLNPIDDRISSLQIGGGSQRLLNPATNVPLEEFRGSLAAMARNQHGCRYLQKKLEAGSRVDVDLIFGEVGNHVCQLMMDQYGNQLVHKLLDVCDGIQFNDIVMSVTEHPDVFVSVSCNVHGTRIMQKLLERLVNRVQQARVIRAMTLTLTMTMTMTMTLTPAVVPLVNDAHGHHVVLNCLKKFPNELKEPLFEQVRKYCADIAKHQNGCCVLQSCMQLSYGVTQDNLLSEVARNSLDLAQDPYGNYVVQLLLDMNISQHTMMVLGYLEGSYASLSMQKCSSHVVERCLKLSRQTGTTQFVRIIRELITGPDTLKLLQDAYGNYVIQSALRVSLKTSVFYEIASTVRRHDVSLRSHPYGKRILQLIDQLTK